jgi:TRAP-type C4-dicarboxylate transport system substrate-binding protein
MPLKITVSQGWHWWAEELEKRTEGKVKVEFYPNGTLFALAASVDSCIAGVADISQTSIGGLAQRYPLSNLGSLPTASFPDTVNGMIAANKAYVTLIEKFPEVAAEWKDVKVLGFYQMMNYGIQSKKVIRVPDDLKGVKIGGDGLKMDLIKLCGAVGVTIAPPDLYMNLQTGVIDAGFSSWSHVQIYHLCEVVSYFLDYGFGATTLPVIMNLNSWNALPPDIQKIMMELIPESQAISAKAILVNADEGRKIARETAGKTTVTLTPDQIKLWQEKGKPLDDAWLAEMKAKGAKNPELVLTEWKRLALEAWK